MCLHDRPRKHKKPATAWWLQDGSDIQSQLHPWGPRPESSNPSCLYPNRHRRYSTGQILFRPAVASVFLAMGLLQKVTEQQQRLLFPSPLTLLILQLSNLSLSSLLSLDTRVSQHGSFLSTPLCPQMTLLSTPVESPRESVLERTPEAVLTLSPSK